MTNLIAFNLSYNLNELMDLPTISIKNGKILKLDLGNMRASIQNNKIIWEILVQKTKRIQSWEVIQFIEPNNTNISL